MTGAFAFASLVTTKEIGVGMTVAVLVDATFIRLLLVPATMRLLGRWNWWLPGPAQLPPDTDACTLGGYILRRWLSGESNHDVGPAVNLTVARQPAAKEKS